MFMVGSPQYYSFWVFKMNSDAQCWFILSMAAKSIGKSFQKMPCTDQEGKCCFYPC